MFEEGQEILDKRYRVIKKLGGGAFGEIYKGTWTLFASIFRIFKLGCPFPGSLGALWAQMRPPWSAIERQQWCCLLHSLPMLLSQSAFVLKRAEHSDGRPLDWHWPPLIKHLCEEPHHAISFNLTIMLVPVYLLSVVEKRKTGEHLAAKVVSKITTTAWETGWQTRYTVGAGRNAFIRLAKSNWFRRCEMGKRLVLARLAAWLDEIGQFERGWNSPRRTLFEYWQSAEKQTVYFYKSA